MKALQYFGEKDLRFVELPKPHIGPDDVLMRVKKVGICGTDLHAYSGGTKLPTPLTLGHEFVGDIAEVGDNVVNIKVGDRAVAEHVVGCGKCSRCEEGRRNLCISPKVIGHHMPGALAEYMLLPANLVFKLPEDLSYDEGVMVEPLSIAVYAVRKSGLKVGDSVAVVGQGPIGLLVDFVAKSSGAGVYGFDRHDNRIGYAREHEYIQEGFNIQNENFIEEFKKLSGEGADLVFEAVGSDSSAQLALDLAKPGGRIMVLGVFEHDVMINMMQIVRKELEIFGSWTCVFSIEETMKLMQVQRLDINSIITHRYKFEDGKKAFEDALTDKEGRIKSIIEIF